MWDKIISNLKGKISAEWLECIKEKSLKDNILTLAVPNMIYLKRFEEDFKSQIQTLIKEKYGESISIQFQITDSKLSVKPTINDKKIKTETLSIKKTKFSGRPYFESSTELSLYTKDANLQAKKDIQNLELTSMPNKYGIKDVAAFSLFDSKFFTYPNDKRKKAKVELNIRFDNGTIKTYDLYRGQLTLNDIGRGQLTTTHARIFLAIIHIWQKQGCKFADAKGWFSAVDISMRELAKQLGYQKVSGADYRRLLQRVKELSDFPVILADKLEAYTFTFLGDVIARTLKKNKTNKLMLRLTFNPFISKQLYERRAVSRNPECYRIKNPTAFKFLLCYDKRIIKGNNLKLEIHEVAKDLGLVDRLSDVILSLKTAIQELNGYELNDQYQLYAELIKDDDNQWIVAVNRVLKQQQPLLLNNYVRINTNESRTSKNVNELNDRKNLC
jgi:hypothetical protein